MSPISRVVTFTPKPEKMEEAIAHGAKFAKAVEDAEPGCIMYKVSKTKPLSGDGPEQIVMAMIFKDEAAFKAHEESAHVQAYKTDSKKAEFLLSPPDVRVVTPAGGFSRT
ncbi:hypothetical protein ACHAPC_009086 [Botrytis cinerea]|uniref:ABM domain-containing protein n=2 Tax=Sclerotiniaceae TaxID=28983 RepID=A0A4Y8D024_9HELO|nr:putative antibiotic biosynthesis monooxygenase protein [Botrytis cinerea BcDW1]TEY59620.1 hypothetical protein BOTCAL_0190g00080 [Botryotinia calthae]